MLATFQPPGQRIVLPGVQRGRVRAGGKANAGSRRRATAAAPARCCAFVAQHRRVGGAAPRRGRRPACWQGPRVYPGAPM